MSENEYQEDCKRTLSDGYDKEYRFNSKTGQDLVHAHMGLSSEVGEIGDALKKYFIYGQELDETNIKEEIGDVMWYLCLLASSCDFSIGDCMKANIDKLKIRYPEKFTTELAKERLDKK